MILALALCCVWQKFGRYSVYGTFVIYKYISVTMLIVELSSVYAVKRLKVEIVCWIG